MSQFFALSVARFMSRFAPISKPAFLDQKSPKKSMGFTGVVN
ncbi:hypothetical protein [Polynucleobacter yangtzensis]|nr:hypothetical protein [Polynucleobacter yangtzensis]